MGKTVWCIMIIFWILGGFGHKGPTEAKGVPQVLEAEGLDQ